MALWRRFNIDRDETWLIVTADYALTNGGTIVHTEYLRYDLMDPINTRDGPEGLIRRATQALEEVDERTKIAVDTYLGILQEVGGSENIYVKIRD